MIWVLVFTPLGAWLGCKVTWALLEDFDAHVFIAVVVLTLAVPFSAFCGLVFGASLGTQMGVGHPQYWKVEETSSLVSLRNGDGVNGGFFLGSGTIGRAQYYFFYKKVGKGYQPGSIEVGSNVTIYEEKREGGELKTLVGDHFVNPWVAVFALNAQSPPYAFSLIKHNSLYEFRIPEGSLKQNFVLQ